MNVSAAVVVTLVEFLGGLALISGPYTRWAAVLLAANMSVAVLKVHLRVGFFGRRDGRTTRSRSWLGLVGDFDLGRSRGADFIDAGDDVAGEGVEGRCMGDVGLAQGD